VGFVDTAKQKAEDVIDKVPDSVKETAGKVKDKTGELIEKIGDKVPDGVKDKYAELKDKLTKDDDAVESEAVVPEGVGEGIGDPATEAAKSPD
jgi:uncharacterized protein YjbJ (UPF0337 family)